jgi:hypothetical protein
MPTAGCELREKGLSLKAPVLLSIRPVCSHQSRLVNLPSHVVEMLIRILKGSRFVQKTPSFTIATQTRKAELTIHSFVHRSLSQPFGSCSRPSKWACLPACSPARRWASLWPWRSCWRSPTGERAFSMSGWEGTRFRIQSFIRTSSWALI